MYTIGITGPSGAGKTTALRVLEEMGGRVFDCDAIYHEMLASDGELLGRIEAAFPGSVKNYTLDRKALGARVFADPEGLQRLTDITQPLVARRVLEEIGKTDATSSGASRHLPRKGKTNASGGRPMAAPTVESPSPSPVARCLLPVASFAVIDAIGLFESGLGARCDLTVAVVADPEVRVRRLIDRDGITEEYARSRIAAQKPAEWFAGQADMTLENNGSEEAFAQKCHSVFMQRLPAKPTKTEL